MELYRKKVNIGNKASRRLRDKYNETDIKWASAFNMDYNLMIVLYLNLLSNIFNDKNNRRL